MTIYLVLIGAVIFSIVFTSLQMKLQYRKEMNELAELFEDISK